MATTIQFFNVFIKKDENYTSVNISDFLDNIISLDEAIRFARKSYGSFSLIDMFLPVQNPNNNPLDRLVAFASYRDKKPFTGQRGTDRKDEIPDDVLELTTCLFIPHSHLAIIEYNHFGIRPKNIERYLNNFLNQESGWSIEFIPVETENSFTNVRNAEEIKNIELKLDLLSYTANIFNNPPQQIQSITTAINGTADSFKNIGANVATINLGQGRYRNNMDLDNLVFLLQQLDTDNDAIASIKVKYKNSATHKVETIDLKNEGILKKVILEDNNSTAFESIAIGISEYYYEHSNSLASYNWRTIVEQPIHEGLPLIRRYDTVEELVEESIV